MTTPAERVELMRDIQDQVEEFNRDQRLESADAGADHYAEPRLTRAEIAEMDDEARRDRGQRGR